MGDFFPKDDPATLEQQSCQVISSPSTNLDSTQKKTHLSK